LTLYSRAAIIANYWQIPPVCSICRIILHFVGVLAAIRQVEHFLTLMDAQVCGSRSGDSESFRSRCGLSQTVF